MDKIDKFFSYIFVLALGIGIGMYWRMAQVEPMTMAQTERIQQERKEIKGSIASLDTRIKMLEKRLMAPKGGHK